MLKKLKPILLTDPDTARLEALRQLLTKGSQDQNASKPFWLLAPQSSLYTMIVEKVEVDSMNEREFMTHCLCIIDDKSIRINSNYPHSALKHEVTSFADTIGKPCFEFIVTEKDYTPMYESSRFAGANWRIKGKPSPQAIKKKKSEQLVASGLEALYIEQMTLARSMPRPIIYDRMPF